MPSESSTTSLRSVNSPAFIKKYDKRANCLLSRSCHHCLVGAIIGPRPMCTRECVGICASVRVLALARRGGLWHARVNVQATRVTSSLLALVCQVSCDLYCTPLPLSLQDTIHGNSHMLRLARDHSTGFQLHPKELDSCAIVTVSLDRHPIDQLIG